MILANLGSYDFQSKRFAEPKDMQTLYSYHLSTNKIFEINKRTALTIKEIIK